MKCIKAVKETKHYKLGEIRRTDDQDAEQKVASGVFTYIGKEEWKKEVRKLVELEPKKEVVVEEQTIAEKQLKKKKSK